MYNNFGASVILWVSAQQYVSIRQKWTSTAKDGAVGYRSAIARVRTHISLNNVLQPNKTTQVLKPTFSTRTELTRQRVKSSLFAVSRFRGSQNRFCLQSACNWKVPRENRLCRKFAIREICVWSSQTKSCDSGSSSSILPLEIMPVAYRADYVHKKMILTWCSRQCQIFWRMQHYMNILSRVKCRILSL